jgi:3-hydroxy-9,10-secoandrosta-1,3,5(10)-triene-9,17-dione monooxygenase
MADLRRIPPVPSPETLIERARTLAPALAGRIAEADRLRDIPADTIRDLRDAELLRLFQPAAWGGFESDPRLFFDVQNVIAETCASTAWVYGVLSVQSLVLALFDMRAQADVWGADDQALVSSSFVPVGKGLAVEGGYRIGGRWSFSSGSTHCQWAILGAMVPIEGGPPEARLFLVPRADYEILDVWHTFGLRGTGSNDIVAKDLFVPAYRTLKLDAGIVNVPRAQRPGAPLYRLPWLYLFAGSVSNFAIGAGRGALAGFLGRARTRVSTMTGKASREDTVAQTTAARLHAEIDNVEATYRRNVARMMEKVEADEQMTLAEGLLYRTQLNSSLRKITALVDELMLLLGARGINLDTPLTRAWLDLSAARVHPANDPATSLMLMGQALIESGANQENL